MKKFVVALLLGSGFIATGIDVAAAKISQAELSVLRIGQLEELGRQLDRDLQQCQRELKLVEDSIALMAKRSADLAAFEDRMADYVAARSKLTSCVSELNQDLSALKKEVNKRLSSLGDIDDAAEKRTKTDQLKQLKSQLLETQSAVGKLDKDRKAAQARAEKLDRESRE